MNRLSLALVIWLAFGLVCLIAEYAHAGPYTCTWHQYERGECLPILKDAGPMPPSIKKLMAEGAGRAVYSNRGAHWTLTCDDVKAIVAQLGEARAIAAAQAYGAGEAQIAVARQCLTKKVKK